MLNFLIQNKEYRIYIVTLFYQLHSTYLDKDYLDKEENLDKRYRYCRKILSFICSHFS